MKTYTVTEIAKRLGTSEETVRRWIRTNRMVAIGKKTSNKAGFRVSEESLKEFLNNSPKYITRASTLVGTLSPTVGVATAIISSGVVASLALEMKKKDEPLTNQEVKRIILSEINRKNDAIKKKEESILQIENEIHEIKNEILQYEVLLEECKRLNAG